MKMTHLIIGIIAALALIALFALLDNNTGLLSLLSPADSTPKNMPSCNGPLKTIDAINQQREKIGLNPIVPAD